MDEPYQIRPNKLHALFGLLTEAQNEAGDQSAIAEAQAEGLFVAGQRFVVTRIDARIVHARSGLEGLVIMATLQAIIIAHHGESQNAAGAMATVEVLADSLIGAGY
ncbi:hypothetical protein BJX64DRAFT_288478 [Aspergillus heterothallicus]